MYFLISLLIFSVSAFTTPASEQAVLDQQPFIVSCDKSTNINCKEHGISTIKKYKSGKALKLDFSEKAYFGVCDILGLSVFPYGSTLKLYIKKIDGQYYSQMSFGYISKKQYQNHQTIAPLGEEEISKSMEKIEKDSKRQIHNYKDILNYVNIPEKPYLFFAWIKTTNEEKALHTFGYFASGIFICDLTLKHTK